MKIKALTLFIVLSMWEKSVVYANGSMPSVLKKYDLETLTSDDSQYSYVDALSRDGRVAGGFVVPNGNNYVATIWSGSNFKNKIILDPSFSGSKVKGLSFDGEIAGGYQTIIFSSSASNANVQHRASDGKLPGVNTISSIVIPIVWFGDSWGKKKGLIWGV